VNSFFRVAILSLFSVAAANADSFNFTFTGKNFDVSGVLTGHLLSPGVYQITQITGTAGSKEPPLNQIYGLYSPGEINNADNLLFTNQPFVDSFGINFFVGDGSNYALAHDNLGYLITGCFQGTCSENNHITNRGDLVVTSTVPEPSTLLLFTSGLLLSSLPLRKRLLNLES
jgi:hypothetical protein